MSAHTFTSLALACILGIMPVATALAAPAAQSTPQAAASKDTIPTHVTSERMHYDAARQVVIFEQNVHVRRPDFELWSAKLTLHLKKKAGAEQQPTKTGGGMPENMSAGEIDRIVAEKDVRMQRENKTGTCQKATYTINDAVLLMEGDPVVRDGENVIKGETIRFYTRENRSEVTGGAGRQVEAVFTSPGKMQPGKGE